jgi:site-specific recombinase XerD
MCLKNKEVTRNVRVIYIKSILPEIFFVVKKPVFMDELSRLNHGFRLLFHQYRDYLDYRHFVKRTVKEYPDFIVHFLTYLQELEINDVKETTVQDIQDWQSEFRGQAVGTQCCKLAMVKSFFRFLHKTGKVYVNPASGLEAPRKPKRLPDNMLEIHEIRKVIELPDVNTFIGARDRAILELFYSSGIRNRELRHLKLEDLELSGRRLHLIGKGDKEAYVPFGKEAHKALEHYLKFWRPKMKPTEAWVFVTRWRHGRLSGNDPLYIVRRYLKEAGIEKRCTPHGFRHSCATHLLKAGADIRLIQKLLRHNDLSYTQIYTRLDVLDVQKAQEKYHPREQSPKEDGDE